MPPWLGSPGLSDRSNFYFKLEFIGLVSFNKLLHFSKFLLSSPRQKKKKINKLTNREILFQIFLYFLVTVGLWSLVVVPGERASQALGGFPFTRCREPASRSASSHSETPGSTQPALEVF